MVDCDKCVQEKFCKKLLKDEECKIMAGVIGFENNTIDHPLHYCHGGMECIDEMVTVFGRVAVKHFCLLNVWKYRKRALYKNGEEDMKKADWYMKKLVELEGNENES